SEFRARGSEMESGKRGRFLRNVLVCSIVVLAVGFLGLGVRALELAYITHLAFAGLFVASIMSLVWYFLLHRPDRERAAHPPSRTPPFLKLLIPPPRLSTTSGNSLNLGLQPAKPALTELAVVKAVGDSVITASERMNFHSMKARRSGAVQD
ncbi:MAG: hypothetical protein WAN23_18475, partial [Candidatus Acidiferrales bacterium]